LGVDLVPFKVCTYDCVYCQLGRTTDKTCERRAYLPTAEVLSELERRLKEPDRPNYITLAGSGEPTLNADIGAVLKGIKGLTDIPIVVLTNGSLLWMDEVREALRGADIVIPSLDAGDTFMFQLVNRPHRTLTFNQVVEGINAFTREFAGAVWLEVMLLAGVTGVRDQVKLIAALAKGAGVSKVQLNTVVRPPVKDFARPLTAAQMSVLAGFFTVPTEIIGAAPTPTAGAGGEASDDRILALLSRRPCTVAGLAAGLAIPVNEVLKRLDWLIGHDKVRFVQNEDERFYEAVRTEESEKT
jgi:wyosine [tRNA(Phe)-imidazoG37] synthetase (radical SAM superfamily)